MLMLSEVSVQSPISFGGGFSFSAWLTLDLNRSPLLTIAVEAAIAFLSCWAVSIFGLWVRKVQNVPQQTVRIVSITYGQEVGYFGPFSFVLEYGSEWGWYSEFVVTWMGVSTSYVGR
jgi:hypothetical protein